MIDISKVKDSEAKRFLKHFFEHREVNREFYQKVSQGKFDFRMVSNPQKKSDSPRESLAHQIKVQKSYIGAIGKGRLKYSDYDHLRLGVKSKKGLLSQLEKIDKELVALLTNSKNLKKKIKVCWSKERITPVQMLWGLQEHEILHTGWNLALMDHLNIKRFSALKKLWG